MSHHITTLTAYSQGKKHSQTLDFNNRNRIPSKSPCPYPLCNAREHFLFKLPPPDKKTIWNLIVLVYCHSRLTQTSLLVPQGRDIMKQVFCFLLTFIQSFHSGIKKNLKIQECILKWLFLTTQYPLIPTHFYQPPKIEKKFLLSNVLGCTYYSTTHSFAWTLHTYSENSKNHSKVALKKHNGHLHMYYTHTKSCLRRTEKWKRKKAMRPYFQVENNHKFIIKR